MPTLVRTKSGIYHAVFTYQGKRVWRSTYTKDREEAVRIMEELHKEFPNWKRMKVLQLKDQVKGFLEGQSARATIIMYDYAFRKFAEIIGNKFIRSVTAYDVEVFKSKRLKEVAPASVAIDFRVLKASFNKAVKFGMINKSPFNDVKNIVIPDDEPAYLTEEDLRILLRTTHNTQLKAIFVFAVCTAMRLGEIINMRWENVDLQRGFVHLVNRLNFTLKGRRRRSVPLNLTAMSILHNLGRRSDYVFCDAYGKKLTGDYVSKDFKRSARKAKLSERIHFHSLRHTGASLLVQMAVPLSFVQRILGHYNIRTTTIYAHETGKHLRDSVAKLDVLFENDPPLRLKE
jgi:integrase